MCDRVSLHLHKTGKKQPLQMFLALLAIWGLGACGGSTSTYVEPTSPTPSTSEEEISSTSLTTTATVALDPQQELNIFAGSIGADFVSKIAVGECEPAAVLLTGGRLVFVEWKDHIWQESPVGLAQNEQTPILEATVDDYAPGSGHQSFLIQFDGPSIGGPYFGSILAQEDCFWELVDIVREGGGIGNVAIGVNYSTDYGLTAYSSAGEEYEDLQLVFDVENFTFLAQYFDQFLGD